MTILTSAIPICWMPSLPTLLLPLWAGSTGLSPEKSGGCIRAGNVMAFVVPGLPPAFPAIWRLPVYLNWWRHILKGIFFIINLPSAHVLHKISLQVCNEHMLLFLNVTSMFSSIHFWPQKLALLPLLGESLKPTHVGPIDGANFYPQMSRHSPARFTWSIHDNLTFVPTHVNSTRSR